MRKLRLTFKPFEDRDEEDITNSELVQYKRFWSINDPVKEKVRRIFKNAYSDNNKKGK